MLIPSLTASGAVVGPWLRQSFRLRRQPPIRMAASSTSKLFAVSANLLSSSAASITHRRPLTCSASYAVPRIAPYPPDLIKWVRREGGFVHPKLKVADRSSQGLGLIAEGEIPRGTEIIALPDHLPLQLRWDHDAADLNDRPESALYRLVRRVPEELWSMRLGLKLLQERAKVGSFWWPYVGNLPETFNIPIFFGGDEIKSIQYAPLVHQVNKRCKFLIDFENEVKAMLAEVTLQDHPFCGQDVTAASLGWAMSAVSSRAFRLRGRTPEGFQDDIPMLLPLIDMCNHSFQPNARIFQDGSSDFKKMLIQVTSDVDIQQGNPVTLNYGCLSNDLFLLDYGFTDPSNPYDYIELRYDPVLLDAAGTAAGVSSPSFSSPNSWQTEILSRLKLQGEGADLRITLGGPDRVDGRLLAAIRILLSSDVEAVRKQELDTLMSFSVEAPLGVPTEIETLHTVIGLCAISLPYFPTNIMEDENVLKLDVSSSMKLAVQFRMQKKSMIVDVMKELSKRIGQLRPGTSTAQS